MIKTKCTTRITFSTNFGIHLYLHNSSKYSGNYKHPPMTLKKKKQKTVLLPEPLLALFWCELIKSLSLFLSQKGFMVIVKVLSIIVLSAAERFIVVHTVLLVCGFAGGVNHAESKTHDEWPQLHPVHVQAPSRAGVWRGEKKSPKSHCHPPKPISLSWHVSMQSVLILSFDFIHSLLVASI